MNTMTQGIPTLQDVSPDLYNSKIDGQPGQTSTAGATLALAGDDSSLYAVSVNAGVWKCVSNGWWFQLPNSPARAYCLAVDPNNPNHVVVGQRLDDVTTVQDPGIWESNDAGYTWSSVALSCFSQAIPAVAFSNTSTLFVATSCGVARRGTGDSTLTFDATTPGLGQITALAVSESKVWARTANALAVSTDDGVNWTAIPIQPPVSDFTITFQAQGDMFSLAAFDSLALMVFKPSPDTLSNRNSLLIFNVATGSWSVQVLNSGDGTGLGGRRFVKSYVLNRPDLPASLGQRLQLFFCAGQDLFSATTNSDGTLNWSAIGSTTGSGTPGDLHADLWDLHIPPSFGPNADLMWAASDGGVYRKNPASTQWEAQTRGLHTHHIQTITVLPIGTLFRPKLAYACHDNDQWVQEGSLVTQPAQDWRSWSKHGLGDSSWTAGDTGSLSIVLITRHREKAMLSSFGEGISGANFNEGVPFAFDHYKKSQPTTYQDGPTSFQCIQTLPGEAPVFLLDVVMLVDTPFTNFDGQNDVPVNPTQPLGKLNPGGNPVLIRNQQFAANPDADVSHLDQQFWTIEAAPGNKDKPLPTGTQSFWVSGGHTNPVYYVLAIGTGQPVLFKQTSTGWLPLNTALNNNQVPNFQVLAGGRFGPAFVNPYNPDHLYVLTSDGIKFSLDGGASFQDDRVLTGLVTGAGRFGLNATYNGGNFTGLMGLTGSFTGNSALGCLAHMTFNRDNPSEVVAASPFTGVFFNNGDVTGNCSWRTLTPYLPTPLSPVSCVGIDANAIYVATLGRGLLSITGYRDGWSAPTVSIKGEGDPCDPATEGETAGFRVDMSGLTGPLSYIWTVEGAPQPVPNDTPTIAIVLPAAFIKVTITVTVTDGGGCTLSSTLTVSAVPEGFAKVIRLLCDIRKYTRVNFFVNPLWDPLRDFPVSAISEPALRESYRSAEELTQLMGRLVGLYEATGEGSEGLS
jgi:hypothetical protein